MRIADEIIENVIMISGERVLLGSKLVTNDRSPIYFGLTGALLAPTVTALAIYWMIGAFSGNNPPRFTKRILVFVTIAMMAFTTYRALNISTPDYYVVDSSQQTIETFIDEAYGARPLEGVLKREMTVLDAKGSIRDCELELFGEASQQGVEAALFCNGDELPRLPQS